jgi:prepilin-type N-terminal cleavage/methylation domain-containing protein
MRKKGFTLIELIIALAFLMVLSSATFETYNNSVRNFNTLSDSIDKRGNCRIALDFIIDKLRGAISISTASNSVNLDTHKIYLKNNILRYDYDSEQVANNISGFSVDVLNEFLFRVTVIAEDNKVQTIVCLRR